MANSSPKSASSAKCPICGRPTEVQYRPFCSRRCADVNLSRWLSGAYAIPTRPDDDEDGDSTEATGGTDKSGPDSTH